MSLEHIQNVIYSSGDREYYIDPIKGETVTYAEVCLRAAGYAGAIAAGGIQDIAFIRLRSAAEMVPLLLACWQEGVSPAILDPAVKPERIAMLSGVLGCRALISDFSTAEDENCKDVIAANNGYWLNIAEDSQAAKESTSPPELKIGYDQRPALILFSSGTTGVPKCVPLSLANLYANIQALQELINLSCNDSFLCSSPYWYAHGLFNSFLTSLFLGARLVYPGILNMMNAAAVLKAAFEYKTGIYHLTPSMIPILTMVAGRRKEPLPKFRYVISGTARLEQRDKDKFEQVFGVPVSQQYGMTESLIMTLNHERQSEHENSVGRPFGCRLEIRDEQQQSLPPDCPGEIAVLTDAAYGEYFNQPDETAAAYRNGWFYTGDLGTLDQDGYLTVTGRKKELIKRGGFNISPLEINDVLKQLPGIREAATIGIKDELYGEEVYSCVSVSGELTEDAVLAYCNQHLPKSHIPRQIFIFDSLPVTASGKIAVGELKKQVGELLKKP